MTYQEVGENWGESRSWSTLYGMRWCTGVVPEKAPPNQPYGITGRGQANLPDGIEEHAYKGGGKRG